MLFSLTANPPPPLLCRHSLTNHQNHALHVRPSIEKFSGRIHQIIRNRIRGNVFNAMGQRDGAQFTDTTPSFTCEMCFNLSWLRSCGWRKKTKRFRPLILRTFIFYLDEDIDGEETGEKKSNRLNKRTKTIYLIHLYRRLMRGASGRFSCYGPWQNSTEKT